MKCVLCGSTKFSIVYDLPDAKISKCKKCGLVISKPTQNESYKHYHRDTDYKKFEKHFRNIFTLRYNTILKYKSIGKVLEIGASTGVMLQIFKEHGWETLGIEPSDAYREAKKKGLKIINRLFEKADLKSNYFDVVILNHTLEHIDNPVKVLEKVFKILKKDGIVYVDVPNFDSLSAKLAGKNWKYLLPREHLYDFTPHTMMKILNKSGFKIVSVKTKSGIFDVANPFLLLWHDFMLRKKNFIPDILMIPVNIITLLLDRGVSLSVIAKKA